MGRTAAGSGSAQPAFTGRRFRDVLSEFATGVTIIAARESDARFVGFTANSFASVSLDPPLVLWSLSRASKSHLAFEHCERYAISVLAADQARLARRFSRPHADRFAQVPYRLGWADAPLVEGAVAWLQCRHFAWQPVGDHTLFVGEVVQCARNGGAPLLFHQGRFRSVGALPRSAG